MAILDRGLGAVLWSRDALGRISAFFRADCVKMREPVVARNNFIVWTMFCY